MDDYDPTTEDSWRRRVRFDGVALLVDMLYISDELCQATRELTSNTPIHTHLSTALTLELPWLLRHA